jgi:hypothetical protein
MPTFVFMFSNTAKILDGFCHALKQHDSHPIFIEAKRKAEILNPWFTQSSIQQSIDGWLDALSTENQIKWVSKFPPNQIFPNQRLGIIGAGNIPLVVMHDVISAAILGYPIDVKLSSDDEVLPKAWITVTVEQLQESLPIEFVDQLKSADRVIATGSNNTHRYFEYYFRNKPHILRKNRHSVAVLPPHDTLTKDQIIHLGKDVFTYFGMGCRNVTQIWIPVGFDFASVFPIWEEHYGDLIHHHKYANNYNYHKALLLMNLDPHIDAGFVLFKERKELHAPVGLVNYAFYEKIEEVLAYLKEHQDEIQCVVSEGCGLTALPFGTAQCPNLWDYADGVNTIEWLCSNGSQ